MKFLADVCVPAQVVQALRSEGHDVLHMLEMSPGASDEQILRLGLQSASPVITMDNDFGELVFRDGRVTAGVVLVQAAGLSNERLAAVVVRAIGQREDELAGRFTVISPGQVRVRRP